MAWSFFYLSLFLLPSHYRFWVLGGGGLWSRASLFISPFSRSFGGVGGEGFDVTLVTDMDNAGTVNLELVEMNDAKREWGKVGVNRTNQNVLAPTRIHGRLDLGGV